MKKCFLLKISTLAYNNV